MKRPALSKGMSLVLTTVQKEADALALARSLVDEGFAACVSVIPGLLSVYAWRGKMEEERELQLLIKTRSAAVLDLRQRLEELHPYELPEFIVLDPHCSDEYLDWVEDQVPEQGTFDKA